MDGKGEGTSGTSFAPAGVYAPSARRRGSSLPTPVWLALIAVLALGSYMLGKLQAGGADYGTLGGKIQISESDLDAVVGTYTYDGEVYEITAREAIAQQSSLDGIRISEGTYAMPAAESVLSAARTAVLMKDVEGHGITVSDEELLAYASETFGTDDIASLATTYGMDETTAHDRLAESAAIAKLRKEVVGEQAAEPAAPAKPADDAADQATADYAAYIIALAGDEWDSERGVWASDEGAYATALKEYDVRADAATYDAAQTAYNVAYQKHAADINAAKIKWSDYVNTLLSEANLALSSIVE